MVRLDNIYDFKSFQKRREEDTLHLKIINIVENAHLLGSVIQLKTHFREWLELRDSKISREKEFTDEMKKSKIING